MCVSGEGTTESWDRSTEEQTAPAGEEEGELLDLGHGLQLCNKWCLRGGFLEREVGCNILFKM